MKNFKQNLYWITLLIIATLVLIPFFAYFYLTLDPSISTKEKILNSKDQGIILLDRNNQPFFSFDGGRDKNYVPLLLIPKITQQAIIATEDKGFYTHPGFSLKGIFRSLVADIKKKRLLYGGSTITQQLVKNTLLTPNRSITRKFQEIILAQELEQKFSKDEILEMYLNTVYFGEGAIGIDEAAHAYFGKPATELDLAESSILAGILPAPSNFSPLQEDKEAAKTRQKYVLEKMLEQKYITQDEMKRAEQQEISFSSDKKILNTQAIHFAFMVRDELIKQYGEDIIKKSGFRVTTSIDLEWQDFAQQTVKDNVAKLSSSGASNGAAVVIDPKTGEIKALVGSKDWAEEKYGMVNVATSLRQPGSSFKPVVYAAALEQKIITPATVLTDQPITYKDTGSMSPPYKPQNYDKKFRGKVLARRALANSLNVPSVEVLSKLGIDSALEMAQRLGLTTLTEKDRYGLSLTLGSAEVQLLELTGAYSVFANQGQKVNPTSILEIKDKNEQVIYLYTPQPEETLTPEVAFLITSILSDTKTSAEVFGNVLVISRPAAVKTGTSENYRDSLTIGFTPSLTIGVWVGNNDGKPMNNIAGSLGAAPIWKSLMERYLSGTPVEQFEPPAGVIGVTICKENGLLLKDTIATSSAYKEYFIKGTEPTKLCILPKQAQKPPPTPTKAP